MSIGALVRSRAIDGREMDAETLYWEDFGVHPAAGATRIEVLFGEAGVGKSSLVRWIAARIASEGLEPGDGAATPLLVDLERLDTATLHGSAPGTPYDATLLAAATERQLGAWVRLLATSGRHVIWLLDHVETLEPRLLRDVLASALRARGTIVFVCSTTFWQRELRQLLDERSIFGAPVGVAAREVVGMSGLGSQRQAIEIMLHSVDRSLAPSIGSLVHEHWDLAHRALALSVACKYALARGIDELARELRSPGAGAALLDDLLQALWERRRSEPTILPGAYRRALKELARAAMTAADSRTNGPCGTSVDDGSLTYCDVEEAVERAGLLAGPAVRTLEACGMVRVRPTAGADAYELPSESFAERYAQAEAARHPDLPRASRHMPTYAAQVLTWLLFRPEAWRHHLRTVGGLSPTATLSELFVRGSPAARRLAGLTLLMPVGIGVLVAGLLALSGASRPALWEAGATAAAVSAGGGLVLAVAAGTAFGIAYMLFAGLLGGLATGAVASGRLPWLADALEGAAQAGVTESQIAVAFLSGLALSYVAGLNGFGHAKPPVGSVRTRFVSLQSVLVAGAVLVPISAFVVFALSQEHLQAAHERDVLIGSVALFFFAAAVHWRTQRVVPTLASVALLTVVYAVFALPATPPWTLVGTGFQSAVIWTSFFSVGYAVLRDFLFPIGVGTRFALDEGSVAALIVSFAVGLAGLSLVVAGATASPAFTVTIGVGLIAVGLGQRWWRSYLGWFAFVPWDWPSAVRTGRIERHSASWDAYHAVGRLGLSRALRRAVASRPEIGRSYLTYFTRSARATATVRAWEDVALAKAASCRSIEDVVAAPEAEMSEALSDDRADASVRELLAVARLVRARHSAREDDGADETVCANLQRLSRPAASEERAETAVIAEAWQRILGCPSPEGVRGTRD